MNISIPQKTLLQLLKAAAPSVSAKPVNPQMSCFLLKAGEDGGFSVTACNASRQTTASGQCFAIDHGEALVDAAKLLKMAETLPQGDVSIESDEELFVTVKCGRSVFRMQGLDASSFPYIYTDATGEEPVLEATVDASAFERGISAVRHAASTDSARAVLCSVLFCIKAGGAKFVATDGRRLSMMDAKAGEGWDVKKEGAVIIDTDTAAILSKALAAKTGALWIKSTETMTVFEAGGLVIASKNINAQYPNYERIVPDLSSYASVTFRRKDMMDALGRVAVVTSDAHPGVRAVLRPGCAELLARSENGTVDDCVELEGGVTGEGADAPDFAFNHSFLLDALKNMQGDTFTLAFLHKSSSDPLSASDGNGMADIFMPMSAE